MPYYERLGSERKIGPFGLGNKLGREIREGELVWYSKGGNPWGGFWGFGVRVVGPEEAQLEFHGDSYGAIVDETYHGRSINRSAGRDVIRFVRSSRR